jgi:peroxiredoxin
MIKKNLCLALLCLLISSQTIAQIDILKKAVDEINQYKNLSYSQIQRQKKPFSGDRSSITLKSSVSHAPLGKSLEQYNIHDLRGYQLVDNGSVRMELDLKNKTYQIKDEAEEIGYPTPYYWGRFMQKKLIISPEKIKHLPDTTIDRVACFHIKIAVTDSVSAKEIYDLCLNKATYLPIYTKQYLQGIFGKGNITGDNIAVMINESSYADYRINAKDFTDIKSFTIPADFTPEKKTVLLAIGNKAPNWELKNLQGKVISNTQLNGSVALIDFSFNTCAACMLSIPALKRLHEKYKYSNVKVITVNTSDTKQSIIAFAKKNNINYPILINGNRVSKSFQISAYPTFYIIDKTGTVAATFEGYSKDLENGLIEKIDQLK